MCVKKNQKNTKFYVTDDTKFYICKNYNTSRL